LPDFYDSQTGAGKSYTMTGDLESEMEKGINPRMVEKLFERICNASEDLEFIVKISYMEIYMERVRDLLNPANDNLPVHEEKGKGVYVKGLLEVFVSTVDEVFAAMRRGQTTRAVGATSMNNESSRSHSIFVLNITQRNLTTGSTKLSKLSLVDLAGSEKVGKTGASGQTLEEVLILLTERPKKLTNLCLPWA
jgi:kinesin family member 5